MHFRRVKYSIACPKVWIFFTFSQSKRWAAHLSTLLRGKGGKANSFPAKCTFLLASTRGMALFQSALGSEVKCKSPFSRLLSTLSTESLPRRWFRWQIIRSSSQESHPERRWRPLASAISTNKDGGMAIANESSRTNFYLKFVPHFAVGYLYSECDTPK